jgi:hypothetical protein
MPSQEKNFYLCDYTYFWEYNDEACLVSYFCGGESASCDISLKEKTNISLKICPAYSWDYSIFCNDVFYDGERASCDLSTLVNNLSNFTFSFQNPIKFEYIYDFSLLFIEDEIIGFDLILDKKNKFNFELCKSEDLHNYEISYGCDEDRTIERNLVVNYSDSEFLAVSLEFGSKYLTVGGVQKKDFNLEFCTQQTNFSINGCTTSIEVDGKNKNFDIDICHDLQNPDINFQTFIYYNHWSIECGVGWSFLFYDGESPNVEFVEDVFINVDNYSGEISNTSLLFDISMPVDVTYDGEYSDCLLTDNPFDQLESDNYDGEYSNASLKVSAYFTINNYDGEYSDCNLTDVPAPSMYPIGYDGEYSDCTMNVTFALYPIGYDGEYSDCTMNVTFALYPIGYDGEYSDCYFTNNPPDLFDIYYYDGEYVDFELNTSTSFGVKNYDGEYSNVVDIYTPPPTSMHPIGYDGEYVYFELDEDLFYFRNYDGEYSDCTMNVTFALYPIGYDGEYSDCYLGTSESMYFDFIFDGDVSKILELYVHPGEDFEFDIHDGDNLFSSIPLDVELYPISIISSESMYDVERNFNFCNTTKEVSPVGDSVIFDSWESDRKWYGLCGPKVDDEFSLVFSTNQRMSIDFYDGDLFYTSDYHILLAPQLIQDDAINITTIFESNVNFRFCPGYLIPSGDNVNFDFSAEIYRDCFGWFVIDGESVNCSLSVPPGLSAIIYDGDIATSDIIVPGKWVLYANDGEMFNWINLEFVALANDGDYCDIEFERRAYLIKDGEYAMTFDLRTSSPGIKWITPQNECLLNEYVPTDEYGDPDLSYDYVPNAIEYRMFWTRLNAKCVLDYEYYTIFQPFFYETDSFECELSTIDGNINDVIIYDSDVVGFELNISDTVSLI